MLLNRFQRFFSLSLHSFCSGGIMLDNVNESLQLLYNQRAKNKIFKHDP